MLDFKQLIKFCSFVNKKHLHGSEKLMWCRTPCLTLLPCCSVRGMCTALEAGRHCDQPLLAKGKGKVKG